VLAEEAKPDTADLSDRQAQCLALASQGMTSKEIARRIGISPSTVDNHLRVAMMRLGARNRREAVNRFRDCDELERNGRGSSETAQALPRDIAKGTDRRDSVVGIFRLPLGGTPNTFSIRQKLWLVAQIALMATMTFAAIAFTISGLIAVFDR
jgi:DNA-binding CsgD family transcriptional regulator